MKKLKKFAALLLVGVMALAKLDRLVMERTCVIRFSN